jgi:hypothetical protein
MTGSEATAEAFADRVFAAGLGAIDIVAMYIGERLGYYRALLDRPLMPGELAAHTGTSERSARQWLEQQAAAAILTVAADGRYALPPEHAEVLTDPSSLAAMAWLPRLVVGTAKSTDAIVEAFSDLARP